LRTSVKDIEMMRLRTRNAVKVVLESWQPLFELPANAGSIANSSELKPKFQPDFAKIPAF
jgi:hypothetical protein